MTTTIKNLKTGDFFTLKDYGDEPRESVVYVRGEYDRTERKYEVWKFTDANNFRYMKGNKEVYTDFTF